MVSLSPTNIADHISPQPASCLLLPLTSIIPAPRKDCSVWIKSHKQKVATNVEDSYNRAISVEVRMLLNLMSRSSEWSQGNKVYISLLFNHTVNISMLPHH